MEYWRAKKTHFKHKQSGRSKMNAPCKKHPKHRQSPGVCSICLTEKLSQLSSTTGSSRPKMVKSPSYSSSSDLSSLSSSNASSALSPVWNYTRRQDSNAEKSMRVFSHNFLKKSRSMACVLQRRKGEDGKSTVSNDIKLGFWSNLLQGRNKGLMHSRTTRESIINYH